MNENSGFLTLLKELPSFIKMAEYYAKCYFLPKHYHDNPANCLVALQTAFLLNIPPLMFFIEMKPIHGQISLSSKMIISLANKSCKFINGIHYETNGKGDDFTVTAYGYLKNNPNKKVSYSISRSQIRKSGWGKATTLYDNFSEAMLFYRAAGFLCRIYIPEVLSGISSIEEMESLNPEDLKKEEYLISPEIEANTIVNNILDDQAEESIEAADSPRKEEIIYTEFENISMEEIEKDSFNLQRNLVELIEKYEIPPELVETWLTRANEEDILMIEDEYAKKLIDAINKKFSKE